MFERTGAAWITGIGLVASLGRDRESGWSALRAGQCGVRELRIEGFGDPPLLGCPAIGGALDDDLGDEPALVLTERAAVEAWSDAGLEGVGDLDRDRVGVFVGLSKGGLRSLGRLHRLVRDPSADPIETARAWRMAGPDAAVVRLAERWDLRGPSRAPVAACATGLVAVLQAAELVARGQCDVVLAGAGDASLEPFVLGAFRRMGLLATAGDDDPSRAVRPWDVRRRGFVVGEGAAVLVIESADHARRRGARAYAEVAGGALGSDAFHETALDDDPAPLAALIGRALSRSDFGPSDIQYVNVHGTATKVNDPREARALELAFGPAARLSCSANKAQIGHLLGAAGAVELAITCLALRDGFIPPTLNLESPDPACAGLDATPQVGRRRAIVGALKLSVGFGGHIAAAVLRRPDDDACVRPARLDG